MFIDLVLNDDNNRYLSLCAGEVFAVGVVGVGWWGMYGGGGCCFSYPTCPVTMSLHQATRTKTTTKQTKNKDDRKIFISISSGFCK